MLELFCFLDNQRTALIDSICKVLKSDGADPLRWGALCRDVRRYLDVMEEAMLSEPAPTPLLQYKLVYSRKLHDDVEDVLERDPVGDLEETRRQMSELLDLLRSLEAYDRHVIYPLAKAGPSRDPVEPRLWGE